MDMAKPRVTRGYGVLEGLLAQQRRRVANRLIPSGHQKGRLLDIGCGTYPLFLVGAEFSEKYGLDKVAQTSDVDWLQNQGVVLINHDVEELDSLPFDGDYFDVVSMLAVVEHIGSQRLVRVLREINRILKPGGVFVMTTPAPWSKSLLALMAKLRLISAVEVKEHKYAYSHSLASSALQQAGFAKENLRLGYFEMFLNTWATATK